MVRNLRIAASYSMKGKCMKSNQASWLNYRFEAFGGEFNIPLTSTTLPLVAYLVFGIKIALISLVVLLAYRHFTTEKYEEVLIAPKLAEKKPSRVISMPVANKKVPTPWPTEKSHENQTLVIHPVASAADAEIPELPTRPRFLSKGYRIAA